MTTDLGLPTLGGGLDDVPTTDEQLSAKDFTSDQEVRWCPGCGDYAVLAAVRGMLPDLGVRRENIVCISGIGCSSRFPYYLDTYGMHSIHGRAPAIATGLATTRPDLNVWVVTGDGDALSIGGNHLIHALRRNVNITIMLFNNRIYGLTKGQYSPTSDQGTVTKSSPSGSVDTPLNPLSLALGAEATFVARTMDSDRAHLTRTLQAAASHRGSSLVEIYQNCPIFNDGAFAGLKTPDDKQRRLISLEHDQPITFGPSDERYGVTRDAQGRLQTAKISDINSDEVVVHDAHAAETTHAYGLSRLGAQDLDPTVTGIFRAVERPTYDDEARTQNRQAAEANSPDLQQLLTGNDTWSI